MGDAESAALAGAAGLEGHQNFQTAANAGVACGGHAKSLAMNCNWHNTNWLIRNIRNELVTVTTPVGHTAAQYFTCPYGN
ncbi:hypothetical protein RE9425_42710 [Prescottella equi]|nr:hypothetical protein RE9425_42710 [Prescottella equi]BDC74374.1 hypothetical protein KAREA_42890 [Prescottella equi]